MLVEVQGPGRVLIAGGSKCRVVVRIGRVGGVGAATEYNSGTAS